MHYTCHHVSLLAFFSRPQLRIDNFGDDSDPHELCTAMSRMGWRRAIVHEPSSSRLPKCRRLMVIRGFVNAPCSFTGNRPCTLDPHPCLHDHQLQLPTRQPRCTPNTRVSRPSWALFAHHHCMFPRKGHHWLWYCLPGLENATRARERRSLFHTIVTSGNGHQYRLAIIHVSERIGGFGV